MQILETNEDEGKLKYDISRKRIKNYETLEKIIYSPNSSTLQKLGMDVFRCGRNTLGNFILWNNLGRTPGAFFGVDIWAMMFYDLKKFTPRSF